MIGSDAVRGSASGRRLGAFRDISGSLRDGLTRFLY